MNLMRLMFALALLAIAQATPALPNARSAAGEVDLTKAWQQYLTADTANPPALDFPHDKCFRRSAAAHEMPLTLLLAVARGESDFDAGARSHANAHGLMQILWPTTARHLGLNRLTDLYDPCRNVDAGTRYLKELLQRYDGNLHLSLAAYNYGPHRIRAGGRIPDGAEWYSGYIYRHLDYVLGRGASATPADAPRDYASERKLKLIAFGAPYRAVAFVEQLQRSAPQLRLDWFRVDVGDFRVVLLYNGAKDLRRSKAALAKAGFPIG